MAFIRIKRIKGQRYAYRVENNWTSEGPRQKVTGYLGRVYSMERCSDNSPANKAADFSSILTTVITCELLNHGFMIDGDMFRQDAITVDLAGPRVHGKNDKSVVLAMNEGHMCDETLSALFMFQPKGKNREVIAMTLAELCVRAGLKVPHEVFVALFESLSSRMKTYQKADMPSAPKEFYY